LPAFGRLPLLSEVGHTGTAERGWFSEHLTSGEKPTLNFLWQQWR